jgi:GNAT superfamily N-acetyltransferase
MSNLSVRPLNPGNKSWVAQFVVERWSAAIVVSRGQVYRPDILPGFIAIQDDGLVGLVTYRIVDRQSEIISVDGTRPGLGIGTTLIAAVRDAAQHAGCKRVWLITTNDNMNALRFTRTLWKRLENSSQAFHSSDWMVFRYEMRSNWKCFYSKRTTSQFFV